MFPKKCLVECSSLSENSESGLILAPGSRSWCAGTGGSNKWKSQLPERRSSSGRRWGLFDAVLWFLMKFKFKTSSVHSLPTTL